MTTSAVRRARRAAPWLALLAGCAAGADYRRPDLPAPAAWSSAAPGDGPAAADEAALSTWWAAFGDPVLTGLVERAAAANLDLRQAGARLREARARRGGAAADLAPSIAGAASAARTREGDTTTDVLRAGLDATWELDLFGGRRRALEAATAAEAAAAEDVRAARVSLAAEVGLAYLDLRTAEARLALARRAAGALEETERLTRWRAEAGLTTRLDAEQARAALATAQAALPPLEAQAASDRNALAVLLGLPPGALDATLAQAGPIPAAARAAAVGVPAEALRRRPDVRAAERRLAAQTALLGVAQAARLPSLTLSGSIGLESLAAGGPLGGAVTASLGAGLLAPLLDAGRLERAAAAQDAVREQAELAYRAAVLGALREVEDALTALDRVLARRAALAEAEAAAARAAALAQAQYQAGLVAFTTVLDAERTRIGLGDALATSQGEAGAGLVRLYKAVGAGWPPDAAAAPETP